MPLFKIAKMKVCGQGAVFGRGMGCFAPSKPSLVNPPEEKKLEGRFPPTVKERYHAV